MVTMFDRPNFDKIRSVTVRLPHSEKAKVQAAACLQANRLYMPATPIAVPFLFLQPKRSR